MVALASEGNPRQGRMKRHRVITTAALLAAGLLAVIVPVANAGSLLSGYGGPGQGNQAILGTTLIGGGSSGGGSAGGGSGSSGTTAGGGSIAIAEGARGSGHAGAAAQRSTGRAGSRTGAAGGTRGAGGAPRRSSSVAVTTLGLSPAASVGAPPLGISGAVLVYILLAAAALVLTGALTGRLARRPL